MLKNRAKLQQKIRALLSQIDDAVARENAARDESVEFTLAQLTEICENQPPEKYRILRRLISKEWVCHNC